MSKKNKIILATVVAMVAMIGGGRIICSRGVEGAHHRFEPCHKGDDNRWCSSAGTVGV